MGNNNIPEEVIEAKADELMTNLGLPIDHRTDIWRSLKLGITAGIGLGIDKSQEIFDKALAKADVS